MMTRLAVGAFLLMAACGRAPVDHEGEASGAASACTPVGDDALDAMVSGWETGDRTLPATFRCLTGEQQRYLIEDTKLPIEERTLELSAEDALRARLTLEVERAARVWWDTILEGPYSLEGDAELLDVEELTLGGTRIALRVSLGAPAVMTESCEMNEATEVWPADCTRGRIVETLYFDADLDAIEPLAGYADFED